jgi:hypothetical protein
MFVNGVNEWVYGLAFVAPRMVGKYCRVQSDTGDGRRIHYTASADQSLDGFVAAAADNTTGPY